MAGKINLSALNLFITSKCNSYCRYCFYQQKLNKKDDLNFFQIKKLSHSLGKVEVLNISGGEPFLQKDLPKICRLFFDNNKTKAVSIPTNGLLPEVIAGRTEEILKKAGRKRVVICLSLDGTEKMHDQIRGVRGNFKKIRETYEKLSKLRKKYPHLSLRVATVVSPKNYQDLFNLFRQIPDFFPEIEALNLSLYRPSKFGQRLFLPSFKELIKLFVYKQRVADKKRPAWRRLLSRMVFLGTLEVLEKQRQVVPCLAGRKKAVVFANGEVGLCEMLPTVGNIKKESFSRAWQSKKSCEQQQIIRNNRCFCTHEGFFFYSLRDNPLAWPRLVIKSLLLK